jgi:hypothetical protein
MVDPMTLAAVGAALRSVPQLVSAHADTRVLRARADLARAAAQLPAGTEISSSDRNGNTWIVRVGSTPMVPGGVDEH